MIAIINYGAGNLRSVVNAVSKLGYQPEVTSRPQDVLDAQRSLLSVENSLDQTTGNAAIQLITLYKSLAGGWETHTSESTASPLQSKE